MSERARPHHFKISRNSELYTSTLEFAKFTHNPESLVFGSEVLYAVDFASGSKKDSDRIEERVSESKESLLKSFRSPYTQGFASSFIYHGAVVVDESIRNVVDSSGHPFEWELMNLPNDLYIQMIRVHATRFNEKSSKFTEQLSAPQQMFKQRILTKVKSGEYPLTEKQLLNRLGETTTVMGDALRPDHTESMLGWYKDGIVMIAQQALTHLDTTYTHEMFHAISGLTVYGEERLQNGNLVDRPFHSNKRLRVGLVVRGSNRRFRWFNEAVTEWLTKDLLEADSTSYNAYDEEGELLQLMRHRGKYEIPMMDILSAYFEDYDPSEPEEQRVPAWKKMYKSFNLAYAPGFLVKIDNLIQERGIEEAIHALK